MKNSVIKALILILISPFLICPQEQDKPLKEKVKVVNVEVPVRVYYKGKPVDNLTKDDFKIFENKKIQTINGFFIKRKKIGTQPPGMNIDLKKKEPRFFVLIFRTTNYNHELEKGLEYLFGNIIRETDQILVFANNKSFSFNRLENKDDIKAEIKRVVTEESRSERSTMFQFIKQIEQQFDMDKFKIELRRVSTVSDRGSGFQGEYYFIREFLTRYLFGWNQYKTHFLIPDKEKYYNLAKFLENIKGEKWIINFFQMELFPNIVISNDVKRLLRSLINEWRISTNAEKVNFARIIDKLLTDIDRAHQISNDFPAEEIGKLFNKVDTICHSVFIRTDLPSISNDSEYLHKANDLESNLRELTKKTGGLLVASKKLEPALDSICQNVDLYYLLTYAPNHSEIVGNIQVKVNKQKYKVIYDETIRFGLIKQLQEDEKIEGPPVKIKDISFEKKHLTIVLTDFHLKKGIGGKLEIRIQIKNKQDIAIFDQTKNLNAQQKKIKISLNFSGIDQGKYDIVVDVKDLFTQETDTEMLQVKI